MRPIKEIRAPELLAVLRRMESRGVLSTAHKVRAIVGQVLRYATATGRAERDCSGDVNGSLPQPATKHHAAISDPKEVAALFRAIDDYQGGFVVKRALRLAPLLFVRPGELRHAEWAEISLDEGLWEIPVHKMKMKQAHVVPLCSQAMAILEELKPATGTGTGKYVFPYGRAYNRTAHLIGRREMMQTWADYLDWLKRGHRFSRSKQTDHHPKVLR